MTDNNVPSIQACFAIFLKGGHTHQHHEKKKHSLAFQYFLPSKSYSKHPSKQDCLLANKKALATHMLFTVWYAEIRRGSCSRHRDSCHQITPAYQGAVTKHSVKGWKGGITTRRWVRRGTGEQEYTTIKSTNHWPIHQYLCTTFQQKVSQGDLTGKIKKIGAPS